MVGAGTKDLAGGIADVASLYAPRSSIAISFDVLHVKAAQLAAAGREVLVCVDRKTMRPNPLPPDLLKLLQPFALSEGEARRHLGLPGAVP